MGNACSKYSAPFAVVLEIDVGASERAQRVAFAKKIADFAIDGQRQG